MKPPLSFGTSCSIHLSPPNWEDLVYALPSTSRTVVSMACSPSDFTDISLLGASTWPARSTVAF